MEKTYLNYKDNNISFSLIEGNSYLFLGESNDKILSSLMFKKNNNYITIDSDIISKNNVNKLRENISFASINFLDVFSGETIMDELAFPLENIALDKKTMKERINSVANRFNLKNLNSEPLVLLDLSTKAKLLIASALICENKIVVIDNLISLLNKDDYEIVKEVINNYINDNHIVLIFSSDVSDSLLSNKIIVTGKDKVLIEGDTLSVLNEEKIMKRLGYSTPFIVEINKLLKDYGLSNKYILDYDKLGGFLWK